MKKHKLLISEEKDFSKEALALLENYFDIHILDLSSTNSKKTLEDIDFLWIRLRSYIDKDILDNAPKLKAIITATTGLNCINLTECRKRKIKILSLTNEHSFLKEIKATAEHTMSLIFLLLRDTFFAITDVIENENWDRDKFKGYELYKKKVGLVGYGRLGKIVASYLHSFGVNVFIYDPYIKTGHKNIKSVSLKYIFSKSDIISIHAKHTLETHCMINEQIFSYIKKPIYLINTARGEIIDENSLLKALEEGKIKKAALDVLSEETQLKTNENKLIKYAKTHSNLLITPHIGGCCYEAFKKTEIFMTKKLIAYYKRSLHIL